MNDQEAATNLRRFPVDGQVLSEAVLPARGFTALELSAGETLRLVDLEGKQVPDVVCFEQDDLGEYLHLANSMNLNGHLEFRRGDALYSVRCRKMMVITGYSNEQSFSFGSMCSAELNLARYGSSGAANCRDNLAAALAPWGFDQRSIPNAFVPFMNVAVGPDSSVAILEPTTQSGDYYDLRAEMSLVVGISNCPQEGNPCNGFRPTAMGVIVYRT